MWFQREAIWISRFGIVRRAYHPHREKKEKLNNATLARIT